MKTAKSRSRMLFSGMSILFGTFGLVLSGCTFEVSPLELAAPVNVQAAAASPTSIQITWNPVSGANSYYVYRSNTDYGTYSYIGYSTALSYTDGSLQPRTTYYYRVATVNSANEPGPQSLYTSAATQGAELAAPANVQAAAASPTSIQITWNPVSGANSYYVYRSNTASGTYSYIGYSTALSYMDTGGLQPNTTYYYKAAAVNSANEPGPQSSYASAATQGAAGEIRIYNDSQVYNLVWVGLFDVSANNYVGQKNLSGDPLGYNEYVYWENIPAGKTYRVEVKDDYSTGDVYTSSPFTLSSGQIRSFSYDGLDLSNSQPLSLSLGRSLNSGP